MRYNSILEMLDRLPPNKCRLMARDLKHRRRPLTNKEIAIRSGLSVELVAAISKLKSWANVRVETADQFRAGCGITPGNESRHVWYWKRTFDPSKTLVPLSHLNNLDRKKTTRLLKLI